MKLGDNLTLDVTYNYTGSDRVKVDWSKGGHVLVRKFAKGGNKSTNDRYFLKGKASLVLTNIEPNDNGTFKISLSAKDVFKVQKQEVSSLLFQVSILCAYMHACNEFKVPISWLRILHIYNVWNPVIRIAIYLVLRKCYLRGLFGC